MEYSESPAFFLDCAEFFFNNKERELGIRILTSVVELELENVQLFRAVAYKLECENEIELATFCYEKILALRPEYPQPYRDLALILYKQGKFERAIQLLYKVLIGKWDDRFLGMEEVAHMELNLIIKKVREMEEKDPSRKKINIPLKEELTPLLE
jgi:Ca-activated chloride channel homolog